MRYSSVASFFLENRGIRQIIFKNTVWLLIAEGISRIAVLFLFIYVARIFEPAEFGALSFALAFVSIFVIFADFGTSSIGIQELSKSKGSPVLFSSLFTLRILLTVGAYIVMAVGSSLITSDETVRLLILLLGGYVLLRDFLKVIFSFLRAQERMEFETGARIAQSLFIAGSGFLSIFIAHSIQLLSMALLISTFLTGVVILCFFYFFVQRFRILWDPVTIKQLFLRTWPLGVSMAFGMVYIYTDSLMLGFLGQLHEVGWYNAAYRLIGATLIVTTLLGTGFYPTLSRLLEASKEAFQKTWELYARVMILLAIPVSVGGMLLGERIINLFYGSAYEPSALAFQILIIAASFNFLTTPYAIVLILANRQKANLVASGISAVLNIILNMILIPRYSLYGAGIATVISYAVLFSLMVWIVQKDRVVATGLQRFFLSIAGASFASAGMGFVILQPLFLHWNVLFAIMGGGVVYCMILFGFYLVLKFLRIIHP